MRFLIQSTVACCLASVVAGCTAFGPSRAATKPIADSKRTILIAETYLEHGHLNRAEMLFSEVLQNDPASQSAKDGLAKIAAMSQDKPAGAQGGKAVQVAKGGAAASPKSREEREAARSALEEQKVAVARQAPPSSAVSVSKLQNTFATIETPPKEQIEFVQVAHFDPIATARKPREATNPSGPIEFFESPEPSAATIEPTAKSTSEARSADTVPPAIEETPRNAIADTLGKSTGAAKASAAIDKDTREFADPFAEYKEDVFAEIDVTENDVVENVAAAPGTETIASETRESTTTLADKVAIAETLEAAKLEVAKSDAVSLTDEVTLEQQTPDTTNAPVSSAPESELPLIAAVGNGRLSEAGEFFEFDVENDTEIGANIAAIVEMEIEADYQRRRYVAYNAAPPVEESPAAATELPLPAAGAESEIAVAGATEATSSLEDPVDDESQWTARSNGRSEPAFDASSEDVVLPVAVVDAVQTVEAPASSWRPSGKWVPRSRTDYLTQLDVAKTKLTTDSNDMSGWRIVDDLLLSDDRATKSFTVLTLGELPASCESASVQRLRTLISTEEDDELRASAVLALGGLGESAIPAVPMLEEIVLSGGEQSREAAQVSLACLGHDPKW